MPLYEVVNLVEMSRVSQAIASDLKNMTHELKKMHIENQRSRDLALLGRQLNRDVSLWETFFYARYLAFVLPLYDNVPRMNAPVATLLLILANTLVFILELTSHWTSSQIHEAFGFIPQNIPNLASLPTLISTMFIHGGAIHLLANMFFLWTFGDNIEDAMSWKQYLSLYFFSGVMASLCQYLLAPTSAIPMIGASGAISGLLGAYLLLYPHAIIKTLVLGYIVDIPVWIYLGAWFVMQLIWTSLDSSSDFTSVAWGAHVGGFLAGWLMTQIMLKTKVIKLRKESYTNSN